MEPQKTMLEDIASIGKVNVPAWIVVHHTGGTNAKPLADTSHHTFEMVNNDHKSRGYPKSSTGYYIGYHYFIAKDGKVSAGRLDSDIGAHVVGMNDKSIGICLAGNFDATLPTNEQIMALKVLLTHLMTHLMGEHALTVDKVVPHRHFASKTCYGNKLSDTWAQELMVNADLAEFERLQKRQLEILKKYIH